MLFRSAKKVRRIPLPAAIAAECQGKVGRLVPFASASSYRKTIQRKAGLPTFHPHRMRHTFACQWIAKGGSLAALQEMLGHQSITTTQIYARLSADMVQREAQRVWAQEDSMSG